MRKNSENSQDTKDAYAPHNLKKKAFFFYELHIWYLPLALILKFFGQVYVFRYRGLCEFFLKNEFFPSINDFQDIDQWLTAKESAHEMVQKNFARLNTLVPSLKIRGHQLDLQRLFIQRICIDYEFYYFFIQLVQNHRTKNFVVHHSFRDFLVKNVPQILPSEEKNILFLPFHFLDHLFFFTINSRESLKVIYRLFRKNNGKFPIKKYQYFCSGISENEFPKNENHLNFSWLVSNRILKNDEILYILETEPNLEVEKFLAKNSIHSITKASLIGGIGFSKKIRLISEHIWTSLRSFPFHYSKQFAIEAALQYRLWFNILNLHQPAHFLYSFSCGWPEQFNILPCKTLNIKTMMWFYSAGEFLYSQKNKTFQDISVRYCIFESDELWVWSQQVKDIFYKRLLLKEDSKKIFVSGPILNGNWTNLQQNKMGQRPFTICIFDLTPMNTRRRLNEGEGPFCNPELQEMLYQTILKIHEHFPTIEILIKTKRKQNPLIYDISPTLMELSDAKVPRIQFLDTQSDPYQAIAAADLVISTPYSSPTMLALAFGKNAVYYDPIKLCQYSFQNIFQKITIQSQSELIQYVQNLLNKKDFAKEQKSEFEVFTPESLRQRVQHLAKS